MRRLLSGMALATALVVALVGCSLWHDGEKIVAETQQGIAAAEALSALTEELRARDDVESAESRVMSIFQTANITVELRDTATAAAIAEITTRVDEALRSEELRPFDREFSVLATDVEIWQTSLDSAPIDYSAELAYWGAAQSAVGAEVALTLFTAIDGTFVRHFATHSDAAVVRLVEHYDELVELEQPDSAETTWWMPGITSPPPAGLPERRVLAVLASMARDTNLLDDSVQEAPPGVYASLAGAGQSFPPRFALVANLPGQPIDDDAAWALTLELTGAALAADLPAFQLAVQSYREDTFEDANLHVGDCTEANPSTASDRRLVADLRAAGIRLPADAAGICLAFATA